MVVAMKPDQSQRKLRNVLRGSRGTEGGGEAGEAGEGITEEGVQALGRGEEEEDMAVGRHLSFGKEVGQVESGRRGVFWS